MSLQYGVPLRIILYAKAWNHSHFPNRFRLSLNIDCLLLLELVVAKIVNLEVLAVDWHRRQTVGLDFPWDRVWHEARPYWLLGLLCLNWNRSNLLNLRLNWQHWWSNLGRLNLLGPRINRLWLPLLLLLLNCWRRSLLVLLLAGVLVVVVEVCRLLAELLHSPYLAPSPVGQDCFFVAVSPYAGDVCLLLLAHHLSHVEECEQQCRSHDTP
jgi:hypothetical protein